MFKVGDILMFKPGIGSGVMEVKLVDNLNETVHVNFIEDHPYVNSGVGYIMKQKHVTKDDTYYRLKKLKKLMKNVQEG